MEQRDDAADSDDDQQQAEDDALYKSLSEKPILDGTFFKLHAVKKNEIFASCNLCEGGKRLKASTSSLSNYTGHLKRCHPDNIQRFNQYRDTKKLKTGVPIAKNSQGRSSCKFNQDIFNKNITKFILSTTVPLYTVENPSFRKIFDDMEIKKGEVSLKHMSRAKLATEIDLAHKEEMKNIYEAINNAAYVCTTSDVWKNKSRQFLGVTAHWIDEMTLECKSAAIACSRFPGSHTFDQIGSKLSEINRSFSLNPADEKFTGTTTDNATNFAKAFREFGVESGNIDRNEGEGEKEAENLESEEIIDEIVINETRDEREGEEEDSSPEILLPSHVRCSSHTVNLICAADFCKYLKNSASPQLKRMHQSALKKCNILWNFSRSPQKKEKLFNVIKFHLPRPVEVRWNSLFDSFKSILKIQQKIDDISTNLNFKDSEILLKSDFEYIETYLMCMKPLAEALDILQANNAVYGFLIPTLISIKVKLLKLLKETNLQFESNHQIAKIKEEIIQHLINSFDKRFEPQLIIKEENMPKFFAALSHPYFKNEWLEYFKEDREKIKDAFLDILQIYINPSDIPEISLSSARKPEHLSFFLYSMDATSSIPVESTGARNIMDDWFKESSKELNVLNSYPIIKKIFLRYNTLLCSSAPVERLFSYATVLDLPKYNRLTDKHFEMRVLYKANSKQNYK